MVLSSIKDEMAKGFYSTALTKLKEIENTSQIAKNQDDFLLQKMIILYKVGKYKDSISIADDLISGNTENNSFLIDLNLELIALTIRIFDFKNARNKIESTLKLLEQEDPSSNNFRFKKARICYLQGLLHYKTGFTDKMKKPLELSIQLYQDCNDQVGASKAEQQLANYYARKFQPEKAIELLETCRQALTEVGNKEELAYCLQTMGWFHLFFKGNKSHALDLYKESIEIFESLNNRFEVAITKRMVAEVYFEIGAEFLNPLNEALKILEEIANKFELAITYQRKGYFLAQRGTLLLALEFFETAFKYSNKFGSTQYSSMINFWLSYGLFYTNKKPSIRKVETDYNDILEVFNQNNYRGGVYLLVIGTLGEIQRDYYNNLDQATIYLQEAIDTSFALGDRLNYGYYSTVLGNIHKLKGNYQQAKTIYESALETARALDQTLHRDIFLTHAYFHLIELLTENFPQEDINQYVKDMEKFSESIPESSQWHVLELLARGIFHKSSKRIDGIFHAKQLFQQVLKRKNLMAPQKSMALLNMCEVLILELKISDSPNILLELKDLITQIQTLGTESMLSSLKIEGMLLEAHLEQINNNFEDADGILDNALKLAERINIPHIIQKIKEEKNGMQESISLYQDALMKNRSLSEKINESRLMEYIKNAKNLVASEFRM
ncbi:MAG: tetratricopeptide repeat protein [Candidatus Kariarchaeaceae archaeon]